MKNINKNIEIANCSNLSLMNFDCNGDLLLVGNFNGICGNESQANIVNIRTIMMTLKNNHTVYVMGGMDTVNYFYNFIKEWSKKLDVGSPVYLKRHFKAMFFDKYSIDEIIPEMKRKFKSMGKVKNIIVNPPYKGSLHLDFFETCFDNLDNLSGRMVIIEPATWLINVRKNGRAKKYDEIKKKLGNHIQSVVIENLNIEFGTGLYVPFATTTIDNVIDVLKSIYGIDLMADNVEECRNNLYKITIDMFPEITDDFNINFKVRSIIRNRIQWCDSLKFDYNHWPHLSVTPRMGHMNITFKEVKKSEDTKFPMWFKDYDDCEPSLFE